jgi:predicted SnoaL-like aldol condensation-catalyzing enzyme
MIRRAVDDACSSSPTTSIIRCCDDRLNPPVQHNPTLRDGSEAFREFMAGPGKEMIYRDVFKIIGQGNFVMVCSHVFLGEETALFDLFRVDDGKIVEHWDNMEPLPDGPQPNSGKF